MIRSVSVIDSHTAGEPTRVVVAGVDPPAGDSMSEKRASFARDYDWLRRAVVCEPRGHDAMVGAMLCEPTRADCIAGVVFFNNVGVLNGCLHGTIGLAETLRHLGRVSVGDYKIETPTGVVTISLDASGEVAVRNVRSYRYQEAVTVPVDGLGLVRGDVAWGGNWFFLSELPDDIPLALDNLEVLTQYSWQIRCALNAHNITGEAGAEIDHIELFGPPADANADSKNFVLCPGKAYDRSPCGTGTSAKLACLHADGLLYPGQTWRQAGILDTVFVGSVESAEPFGVYPRVVGSAHITLEATLRIDPADPFAYGIGGHPKTESAPAH